MTEELDGGPPVVFARVPIRADDTPETLARRVRKREHNIYPQAAQWYCQGRLTLTDRGAELDGEILPPTGLDADGLPG